MAKRRRGNGEGSVHKVHGKNLWRAVVTLGNTDGKRRRAIRYGKSKAEALEELRKLTAGGPKAPTGSGHVSTATLVNRYLERNTGLAPSTRESYRVVARTHVVPRIGMLLATKVNQEHVRSVLDEMEAAGSSASKRCHALTVMRQAFKLAVEEGVVGVDPTVGVVRPRKEHHEVQAFSGDRLAAFMDGIRGHALEPLFVTAVGTGMRQGELLSLRWEDVDLEAATIVVRRTVVELGNKFVAGAPKTKAGRRSITLPGFVVAALRDHRGAAEAGDLVFRSRNGKTLRRQNLGRTLKLLLKKSGLPGTFRFHDQRHTSASLLLAAGENAKVVQERLGHSRITTTLDVYAHTLPGMQAAAATRLDAIVPYGKADDDARPSQSPTGRRRPARPIPESAARPQDGGADLGLPAADR